MGRDTMEHGPTFKDQVRPDEPNKFSEIEPVGPVEQEKRPTFKDQVRPDKPEQLEI